MAFTALLVGSLATTGYSAYQQRKGQKSAANARKRTEELEQKRADLKTARVRAQQVRKGRAERAKALVASSTGGGGTGGSGLVGAQANIGNQVAGNLGFLNKNQEISASISDLNVASGFAQAKYSSRAQLGEAFAGGQMKVAGLF